MNCSLTFTTVTWQVIKLQATTVCKVRILSIFPDLSLLWVLCLWRASRGPKDLEISSLKLTSCLYRAPGSTTDGGWIFFWLSVLLCSIVYKKGLCGCCAALHNAQFLLSLCCLTGFELVQQLPTPSFQFGGKTGNSVTALIFKRVVWFTFIKWTFVQKMIVSVHIRTLFIKDLMNQISSNWVFPEYVLQITCQIVKYFELLLNNSLWSIISNILQFFSVTLSWITPRDDT